MAMWSLVVMQLNKLSLKNAFNNIHKITVGSYHNLIDSMYLTTTGGSITGDTTLNDNHSMVFCDCISGSITITLPNAVLFLDKIYNIKKIDTSGNGVIVNPVNGQTIDGDVQKIINSPYSNMSIISNGSNWFIL